MLPLTGGKEVFDESPEGEHQEEPAKDGKDGCNVGGSRGVGGAPCLLPAPVLHLLDHLLQLLGQPGVVPKRHSSLAFSLCIHIHFLQRLFSQLDSTGWFHMRSPILALTSLHFWPITFGYR